MDINNMEIRDNFNSEEPIDQEDYSVEDLEIAENIDAMNSDDEENIENSSEDENESDDNKIPISFKYDKNDFN